MEKAQKKYSKEGIEDESRRYLELPFMRKKIPTRKYR